MSKIPPVAKSNSLPKSNASSEAHAGLLTMAWSKLDALVTSLFGVAPADRHRAMAAANDTYRAKMNALAADVDTYRTNAGERLDDMREVPVEALQGLAQRLRAHADYELGAVDETWFLATVRSRQLEQPLYVSKGSRTGSREELAGFVDIACDLDIPTELSVFCNPEIGRPQYEEALDYFFIDPSVIDFGVSADELDGVELPAPTWFMGRAFPRLWIDIRPTDTPIGQLIRELKALREFADGAEAKLLLVVETIDETKRTMLKHEGILVVTRQELEQL